MFWNIVIGIVALFGFLIAAAVVFVIYSNIVTGRKEKRVKEEGRPILTAMVMANTELQNPDGLPQVPGLVVFGFYEPTSEMAESLQIVAETAYKLYITKDLDSLSPECRNFALKLKDHNYTEDRRHPVPSEISESLKLFAADLWIYRDRMPSNAVGQTLLACAATGEHEGEIIQLPVDDPDAIKIYESASVA